MFALKLFGTHAIMSLVQFLFMPAFFGLWQDNVIYQGVVGIMYIAIFWLIIYADVSSRGSDDYKNGSFTMSKGFITGAIASIPAIIVYVAALIYGVPSETINWFMTVLRIWLVPYTMLFTEFEQSVLWIVLAAILIYPVVTGVSYIDGKRRRKNIVAILEKAKESRIDRSKTNYKRKT